MTDLSLKITDDLLEALAARVAEMLLESGAAALWSGDAEPDTWLNVKSAAEYLDCPRSRIYDLVSFGDLQPERDGSRLLFKRSDLDAYVRAQRTARHRR